MSFLARLSGPTDPPRSTREDSQDEGFGGGLDEHAHLIVARWSDAQRDEYLGYGAEALAACRDLEEGRFVDADRRFTSLLARADAPRHLLRDAGRAKLFVGDRASAEALFLRFLGASRPDVDRERRFETRIDLASIADERGEVDRAIEILADQLDESDDLGASLALGRYLRARGFFAEGLEVVRARIVPGSAPETAVLEEAGLCEFGRGDLPAAERYLAEVLRRAQCSCGKKVPEQTGVALAAIYERTGRPREAAEILQNVGATCRG